MGKSQNIHEKKYMIIVDLVSFKKYITASELQIKIYSTILTINISTNY